MFIFFHLPLNSGWNPPFALNIDCPMKFQSKDQSIHRLQEGISFGDGSDYTVKGYQKYSSDWSKQWKQKYYACPEESNQEGPKPTMPISSESTPVGNQTATAPISSSTGPTSEALNESNLGENTPSKPKMTPANLEKDYWEIVETGRHDIDVDYGNDVDTSEFGSGFPISDRGRSVNSPGYQDGQLNDNLPEPEFGTEEFYKETYWNLNNIPNSKNSVLRHLKVGINGINVPWLYFGCLFSTFCWHNEDNYMYSINYHHRGAPKQWYGVPGTKQDADGVERVFKNYLSMKMRDVPDLLHHITTSFSPRLLNKEGVRVCKLLQNAGEFIVTFPRAFHGGFSLVCHIVCIVCASSHLNLYINSNHTFVTMQCHRDPIVERLSTLHLMIGFHMQLMQMRDIEPLPALRCFPMTDLCTLWHIISRIYVPRISVHLLPTSFDV